MSWRLLASRTLRQVSSCGESPWPSWWLPLALSPPAQIPASRALLYTPNQQAFPDIHCKPRCPWVMPSIHGDRSGAPHPRSSHVVGESDTRTHRPGKAERKLPEGDSFPLDEGSIKPGEKV
jgi:hypothetical protein